jgi:magnesium-transporting ATPase (P-type)
MAQDAGIAYFTERDANTFTVQIEGSTEKYELIKIFEFDSVRKAMSVLVKHPKK